MWFNVAAATAQDADTKERAAADRDAIAAKMLPADVAEAQRRATVCQQSDYKDCN
jgi:hypothetical protein